MERCYEYLGCTKTDCIAHGSPDGLRCWEVAGTLCHSSALETLARMGKDRCEVCIFRQWAAEALPDTALTRSPADRAGNPEPA